MCEAMSLNTKRIIIAVLATGLTWIGMESFGQQVILGIVILAAVLLDRIKRS